MQGINREHDSDRSPIGIAHNNLLLDTIVYEVQLPDGHVEDYAENIIEEKIY